MLALLHVGREFSLGAWYFEPSVVSGTFIAVGFYLYGAVTIRGAFVPWRAALFLTGVAAMFLALVSPLDAGAERLLSLHMLQHVFLTTIGPPLVLLGLPPELLRPVVTLRWLHRPLRLLTHPLFAGPLFIVNMWLWHVPFIYDLALTSQAVHIFMHVAFMGTGLLFWWPVLQPARELPRYGDGARVLYLAATGMPMALLALLFFASNGVIYPYYESAEPLWGISARNDQQVAGLIMGALGEAASFVAITWLFVRFLDAEEAAAPAPVQAPGRGDAV